LEPDEATLADFIPDPHIEAPDAEVGREDMLTALGRLSRQWPKIEREVFQLHFLEGMSIDDVAHAFECTRSAVDATVTRLRARLRTLLSEMTGTQGVVAPSSTKKEAYHRHLRDLAGKA
jgi:RNA polymerase sigma factor (sigma-70 family)